MKTMANLLIVCSVVLGVVSAATAYLPRLSLPDEQLIGLTLNANAGAATNAEGKIEPIAKDDETITAEMLGRLRQASVQRVRVKEFSFGRWTHRGWFLLAGAGLLIGAWLLRRPEPMADSAAPDPSRPGPVNAEQAIQNIRAIVSDLIQTLPGQSDVKTRLNQMVERLGEAQGAYVPAFVEARSRLTRQFGLSGYAEIMDRFAAAERQINRAWSAAADGAYEEAWAALNLSDELWRRVEESLVKPARS